MMYIPVILKRNRKKVLVSGAVVLLLAAYLFCLPRKLFHSPCSLIVTSSNGSLLGAHIASDGQWRFPERKEVPDKFAKCIISFEDKRFYHHWGIDIQASSRALIQNIRRGRKVSGASTISMQVIRLYRGSRDRSYFEKIIEMCMATRLELTHSKNEILSLYASHAPFGGNVVGLDAASWRYFGKPADHLSWGESAALAVLPNSPALVHPGRNRQILKAKRDRLLNKMRALGIIDSASCVLACLERLPAKPYALPSYAPQLTDRLFLHLDNAADSSHLVRTTVNAELQKTVNRIMLQHKGELTGNGIHNAAAIVLDVKTGNVLAYTGNLPVENSLKQNSEAVDNITAPRSTGSILKPMLYASMMQDGELLPDMLVPDIPTYINSYSPKNFDFTYDGAVPANRALARSLNIPAVHLLQEYKPSRFVNQLQRLGLKTINKSGDYYGLSLILGGAEATLWDLSGVYAGMARTLLHYKDYNGRYIASDFREPNLKASHTLAYNADKNYLNNPPIIGAGAIWLTFDAMVKVARPDEQKFWKHFGDARKIAWKTGTSFGNRDAWAIGCTPDYVVAVWVGNSSGEGRPGLTGISSAAPILFDIFNVLPANSEWFAEPFNDMQQVTICKQSGHIASDLCPETVQQWVPSAGTGSIACPYHHTIHLDETGKWRVHGDCEEVSHMQHKVWFVLPPAEEKYYQVHHPEYAGLPAYRQDCYSSASQASSHVMTLLYPVNSPSIYLPVNLEGATENTIFEVAHSRRSAIIYWHLDGLFLGTTQNGQHQLALKPEPGRHVLTLIDDEGEKLIREFEIIRRAQ